MNVSEGVGFVGGTEKVLELPFGHALSRSEIVVGLRIGLLWHDNAIVLYFKSPEEFIPRRFGKLTLNKVAFARSWR